MNRLRWRAFVPGWLCLMVCKSSSPLSRAQPRVITGGVLPPRRCMFVCGAGWEEFFPRHAFVRALDAVAVGCHWKYRSGMLLSKSQNTDTTLVVKLHLDAASTADIWIHYV